MIINAREYVGAGFPPNEGERLAQWLMNQDIASWGSLVIDLDDCPPALLISAFFNAFLQHIFEHQPKRLEEAKSITWKARFPFQDRNIKEWVAAFAPFTPPPASPIPSTLQ